MTELDLNYQANTYCGMVGKSKKMLEGVFKKIYEAAPLDVTVLILGETGVGKELTAKAIHMNSRRKDSQYIPVNCSAIPEGLFESELYGHVRGAFTGANFPRRGKFREADKGTLYLDEIGSMPREQQPKMLRVLDDMLVTPIGSDTAVKVDVRVIVTTNLDLYREVREGNFRRDLYYRLSAVTIQIPPLRERVGDIPMLIKYFMKKYQAAYGKRVPEFIAGEYIAYMGYPWPGNVRELEGAVKSIITSGSGKLEKLAELKNIASLLGVTANQTMRSSIFGLQSPNEVPVREAPYGASGDTASGGLKEISRSASMAAQREAIRLALERNHWNRAKTARDLKISYKALLYKIVQTGLATPRGTDVATGHAEIQSPSGTEQLEQRIETESQGQ